MDKPKHLKTNYFAPHLELLGQGSGEARTRGEEFRPLSPDFPPCGRGRLRGPSSGVRSAWRRGGRTQLRAVCASSWCREALLSFRGRRGAAPSACALVPLRPLLGARDSPFCPFCGVGVVLSRVISPLGHSSASLGQIATRGGPSRAASWVGSPGRQEGAAWRAAPREPPAPRASPRRAFEERRGPGL